MNKRYSLLLFAMGILIILLLLLSPDVIYFVSHKKLSEAILAFLIPSGLLLLPLLLLKRFTRWYFAIVAILALLAPFALFSVVYFGDQLNFEMTALILFTTREEAMELMRSYIWVIALAYFLYILLLLFSLKFIPSRIERKPALICSLTGLLFLLAGLGINKSGFSVSNIQETVFSYFPFSALKNYYLVRVYKNEILNFKKNSTNFSYSDVSAANNDTTNQVFVLIIGESSRYKEWQINGYNRPTSPDLMRQNNLINFSDVAAAGAITMYSVPQIVTGTNVDNFKKYLKVGGLPELFKQAGFKVYWLSNQELISANTFVQASFADTLLLHPNTMHSIKNVHQDMALIGEMKSLLAEKARKKLFIIHTYGSHYRYQARYPKSFEKFKPVENYKSDEPTDIANKQKLINAYDNTILYTDAVISNCIKDISNVDGNACLIYVSDHGENLYDDSRDLLFHAPSTLSKYSGHVPMFLYCNESYIKRYPNKWKELNLHKNSPISNNQVMATLADMASISYKGETIFNSIASEKFKYSPQKIMTGPKEYKEFSKLK